MNYQQTERATKYMRNNRDAAKERKLSRLIQKPSELFWPAHLQKYPKSFFSSDISAGDKLVN